MNGIPLVHIDFFQVFFHKPLDGFRGDAALVAADEQGVAVGIYNAVYGTHLAVGVNGFDAGVIQVNHALFVAFAGDHERVVRADVVVIDAYKL